jgi:hypothetical protein
MKRRIVRVTAKPLTAGQKAKLDREVRELGTLSPRELGAMARPMTPIHLRPGGRMFHHRDTEGTEKTMRRKKMQ